MKYRLFALLFVLISGNSFSQAFPDRPVRWVLPFPPSGAADILARLAVEEMSKDLGQPIVVDNRPGAGGNIAARAVATAPADGYTMLFATNGTHGINHALYANPGFDPVRDFRAVALMNSIPLVMIVATGSPFASAVDLIAAAKSRPGALNVASSGVGSNSHLASQIFNTSAGIAITHVPYKGGAAAVGDVIAGRADLMIEIAAAAVPAVKSGRVRALAVTTAERNAGMPQVPTLAESGLQGFELRAWSGIVVPAGTPDAAVARLNRAANAAMRNPALRARLAESGIDAVTGTPEQFAALIQTDLRKWGDAVKASGAKAD